MGTDNNNKLNLKQLFVVVCLYFFQGEEERLLRALGLKEDFSDNITSDSDLKKYINKIITKDDSIDKNLKDCLIFSIIEMYMYRYSIFLFKNNLNDESIKPRKQYIKNIQKKVNDYILKNKEIWNERFAQNNRFSRIPFKNKNKKNKWLDVLYVTCFYILRGYSTFIFKKTSKDSHANWPKSSLNDFIQAYYLCWGLYNNNYALIETDKVKYMEAINEQKSFNSLFENRKSTSKIPIFEYCIDHKRQKKHNVQKLGFIINWLFLFIDIFSGNVYKEIFKNDTAFNYYCGAVRRFDNAFSEKGDVISKEVNDYFVDKINDKTNYPYKFKSLFCKTIAKTRFEKAKIFFSMGLYLESLKWHIQALMDTLLMSIYSSYNKNKNGDDIKIDDIEKVYKTLYGILKYLNNERELPIFNKDFLKEVVKENIDPKKIGKLVVSKYFYLVERIIPWIIFILSPLGKEIRNILKNEPKDEFEKYYKDIFSETNFGSTYKKEFFNVFEKGFYLKSFHKFLETIRIIENDKDVEDVEDVEGVEEPDTIELKKIKLELGVTSMFNNIITIIPKMLNSFLMRSGYKARTKETKRGPVNKLVILRRWQSFNPIIPRPHSNPISVPYAPGGGYFLFWHGKKDGKSENKGIVIDPGFNFIQNFYDEGFSIEDIDAVIITHAHIDHDNELSSILTLLAEWNDYMRKAENEKKKIDLFLNEGSYRKFQSWLYSPTGVVNRKYQLQLNVDITKDEDEGDKPPKDEKKKNKPPKITNCKGGNMVIDLTGPNGYNMEIEVIPAIHNEIISTDSAIGVKLRLFEEKGINDTDISNRKKEPVSIIGITGDSHAYKKIKDSYHDCDILVAHLGDIKFKEVSSVEGFSFGKGTIVKMAKKREKDMSLEEFKKVVALMGLIDYGVISEIETFKDVANKIENEIYRKTGYKYHKHLGIRGVYELHKAMIDFEEGKKKRERLMIIGELPEELTNYRHKLAYLLNDILLWRVAKSSFSSEDSTNRH
jgi:ribonuclease BN (tRNA processing enzyme)